MTDQAVTVIVPFAIRKRGGRKLILSPDGSARGAIRTQPDNTMVKAMARAHRWKRMLEEGEFTSATDLAAAEGINVSYVCRILRLTLLAPDIVETIMDGRQRPQLNVDALLKPFPVEWTEQGAYFS